MVSGIVSDTSVLFVGVPACAAVKEGTNATGTARPHAHRATRSGTAAGCSPSPAKTLVRLSIAPTQTPTTRQPSASAPQSRTENTRETMPAVRYS